MGLFYNHKAMQSLPGPLRTQVHWTTLFLSKYHLLGIGICLLWVLVYCILIFSYNHRMWSSVVTLFMAVLMYPLQLIKPRRCLVAAFLKLNIRPSHCPFCEYDLRETHGDSCPECGSQLAAEADVET